MSLAALSVPPRRRGLPSWPSWPGLLLLALAACGAQHRSEPPPGDPPGDPPSDPPRAPQLASAVIAGGAHEIRQGGSAELIVTGTGLAGATALAVGELAAAITSASDAEIRAQLAVPHGFAARSLALRVTTPAGTAELADAIATTLYIVTADAAAGGRGTHESPMQICDLGGSDLKSGDTLSLGAGTHQDCGSGRLLPSGAHVIGAGVGETIISGFGGLRIAGGSDDDLTTISGLTVQIDHRLAALEVDTFGGGVRVDGFIVDAGDTAGIMVQESRTPAPAREIAIRNYRYRGTDIALFLETGATVSDAQIEDCGVGVAIKQGQLDLRNTVIRGCNGAISEFLELRPVIHVVDSELIDNVTGILISTAAMTLDHVVVDNGTDSTRCATGVRMTGGTLETSGQTRIGCSETSISATTQTAPAALAVLLADTEIAGAATGIELIGDAATRVLQARRSHIEGGQLAISLAGDRLLCDLGDLGEPGQNELVSAGTALLDARSSVDLDDLIQAIGTTINGHSYAGQRITGPAELRPDYAITASTIQF